MAIFFMKNKLPKKRECCHFDNLCARAKVSRMRFTIGQFTWTAGRLELRMVGTSIDGRPSTRNPMLCVDHAYRWGTRQAAGKFLKRNRDKRLPGTGWKVLDLRRLGAAA
jgi:hypothetical protein